MRILAVDDDSFILAILTEALSVVGFTDVKTTSSGAEALDFIKKSLHPVDCFLLDIQMPGIDGIDLCGKIRQIPGHEKTPIIMLTAMSDRSYIDRAFTAGATDYVTKPFDVMELGTRVKNAERLRNEIKSSQASHRSLEAITRKLASEKNVPLDAQFDITDVNQFLSYHTFKNYVAMLQKGKFHSSSLFAIQIPNVDEIYKVCKSDEFEYLIGSFSDAISDALSTTGSFFTYAGNGLFVCIYNRLKDVIPDDFSILVQDEIDQLGLLHANNKTVDTKVEVGSTVSPGLFSKTGNTDIIQEAIQRLGSKKGNRSWRRLTLDVSGVG